MRAIPCLVVASILILTPLSAAAQPFGVAGGTTADLFPELQGTM